MAKTCALLVCLGLSLGCARRSPPAPRLWVSDHAGRDVIAVDPRAAQVLDRIDVGAEPRGLALVSEQQQLYVAVADGVAVVDLRRRTVRKLRVDGKPAALAVSRVDGTLWVATDGAGELVAVDAVTGAPRGRVAVGAKPAGVAVRPDGKLVFVAVAGADQVVAVDAHSFAVAARIPVAAGPRAIVLGDDGRTAYVMSERGRAVTVFDAATLQPLGDIAVTQDSAAPAGVHPSGGALSADGHALYVSCGRGASVAILDVVARRQLRSIDGAGQAPLGLALDRDGRHLYSANGSGHNLSIIDVVSGNVDRRIAVGGEPWDVVVAP